VLVECSLYARILGQQAREASRVLPCGQPTVKNGRVSWLLLDAIRSFSGDPEVSQSAGFIGRKAKGWMRHGWIGLTLTDVEV